MANSLITVVPSDKTLFALAGVQDAYLQGTSRFDTDVLRVEQGNRVSYLKFDLRGIEGEILNAALTLTVAADPGSGALAIDTGSPSPWTETDLSPANAPAPAERAGVLNTTFSGGQSYTWDLDPSTLVGGGFQSLIVTQSSGNDVSFVSDEHPNAAARPVLVITVATPTPPPATIHAMVRTPTGSVLSFMSASNRQYAIEATLDLETPGTELTNGIPGTGGAIDYLDPDDHSHRFYRVRTD